MAKTRHMLALYKCCRIHKCVPYYPIGRCGACGQVPEYLGPEEGDRGEG